VTDATREVKFKVCLALFAVLLVSLFPGLLTGALSEHLGVIIGSVPSGWWHFLRRNAPLLRWNPDLIATGAAASLGILGLGHLLSRSLHGALGRRASPPARRPEWRFRWTLSCYAALWVMCGIAFGAAGLWQEIGWVARDTTDWRAEVLNRYSESQKAVGNIEQAVMESGLGSDGMSKFREVLLESHVDPARFVDLWSPILYFDQSNRVAAYLLVARDPRLTSGNPFFIGTSDGEAHPIAELPNAIADLDARYGTKR
jgi:hypothetical protein